MGATSPSGRGQQKEKVDPFKEERKFSQNRPSGSKEVSEKPTQESSFEEKANEGLKRIVFFIFFVH